MLIAHATTHFSARDRFWTDTGKERAFWTDFAYLFDPMHYAVYESTDEASTHGERKLDEVFGYFKVKKYRLEERNLIERLNGGNLMSIEQS